MKKKLFTFLLALVTSVGMSWATTTDLASVTDNYTAQDGEILTGTLGVSVKISIADGATVTLLNANINGDKTMTTGDYAGLTCLGDATITIVGTNSVSGFSVDNGYPGIYVPSGKTLIINGTGSLTAQSSTEDAAGIGAGRNTHCGNIEIQSGKITAIAGGEEGAGIGGGFNANCGNITISGGIVTAIGGYRSAGIGGGRRSSSTNAGHCGNILISGGVVSATSGEDAAAIGGGRGNNVNYKSNCGTITITTALKVYADKGEGSANTIGAGKQGTCGEVTIGGNKGVINTDPYTYRTKEDGEIVVDYINAIGTVIYTQECKDKIDIARELYDALEDSQKTLVTNYQTLLDAEAAYAALIPAAPAGLQVIEMQVPDSWENDQQLVIVPDLPGFVVFTLEEAGTWAAPEGYAHLIYTSKNNEGVRVTHFNNGVWGQEYVAGITRATVFGWASSGHRIFYTTDGPAPALPSWVRDGDDWDDATKTLTVNSNPEAGAYASQSEIENLIFSDAVTSIGQAAFGGCSNISYVSGGNNIQTIGVGAFTMCGFTYIELPASVTTIGNSAFYSCSNLSSVTIGNNVASIGNHAFDACVSLTEITIPASVTTIGVDAFYNCTSMTDVYCYPNAADLTWDEDGCDDFKASKATNCHVIASQLSAYQTKFTGVVNVTFVGDLPDPTPAAGLQVTELQIPASWQGDNTLVTISDLPGFVAVSTEEAEIWDAAPEGDVILIYAGKNDEGVTAIEFNNGVLNGFGPFGGFSRADLFDWGYKNFYTSGGSTPAVDPAVQNVIALINAIPNPVAYNDECKDAIDAARAAYDALTDAQNDLVENYGVLLDAETAYALLTPNPSGECGAQGDNLLWELNTSTGVLTITGSGAMYDWSYDTDLPWYDNRLQITSVVLPSGITSLGTKAFRGCQNLASINMTENYPAGLTAINQEAFCHTALTSVIIPESVVTIGQDAFYQSQSITDVYCYADPNNLTWTDFWGDDFASAKSTQCHVKDCYLEVYNSKWNTGTTSTDVNVTFVGDLPGDCGGDPTPEPEGDGKLTGAFTINADGDQILFSKGNLQYQASTTTLRFATNQFDLIGSDNANISDTYTGWIDLFGWGTGNCPTKKSTDDDDYSTFVDWGTNAISNGGNEANLWRTLTRYEWAYLIQTRTNAADLKGQATVADVHGFVLLPDSWTLPAGLSFTASPNDWTTNVYTAEQWAQMEAAGAVFLPAAGYRNPDIVYVGEKGWYWSSTVLSANAAYDFEFTETNSRVFGSRHYFGQPVRLVTAAPAVAPTPVYTDADFAIDFRNDPYQVTSGSLPTGTEVEGTFNDTQHGYRLPVVTIPVTAGNYLVKMGTCKFSNQDGAIKNEDGSVTYATLATNTGVCYDANPAKNYVAAIITIPTDQIIKVYGAEYTPYFSIEKMAAVPAFTDFELNFQTNPYNEISGAKPEGTEIAGSYNDNQHGYQNVVATVPMQAGNYRLTLGACQFGNGAGNVMSETNIELASFNQNLGENKCYHQDPANNIVSMIFTVDMDQTITIDCGQYTPYMKLEKLQDNTYYINFENAEGAIGTVPGEIAVAAGESWTIPANLTLYKEGYTFAGWSDGVNTYAPGDEFFPSAHGTLQAVYTANSVSIADASEINVKWNFGESNGAPSVTWNGVAGYLLAKGEVDGQLIDLKLDIDATSGKFHNAGRGDKWAQVNANTVFTFPSKEGAVVNVETYSGNATYDLGDGTLTCNANDYYSYLEIVYPAPTTAVVIGDPNDGTEIETFLSTNDGVMIDELIIDRPVYNNMYNTLCLPFDMNATQITASSLNGVIIREFTGASVVGQTLELAVSDPVNAVVAGRPYFVQYSAAYQLDDLHFEGVTINNAVLDDEAITFNGVTFKGTFTPFVMPNGLNFNGGYLFLGQNNKLFWPNTDNPLKPFRAYFYVNVDNAPSGMPLRRGMPARIVEGKNVATGMENVQGDNVQSTKVLENGVLYIIKNDVRYNAQGQKVK